MKLLDWLIGKLWNPLGWILNALDPKGRRLMKRLRRHYNERRRVSPLTHAQLERLRAKIRKEFPPVEGDL